MLFNIERQARHSPGSDRGLLTGVEVMNVTWWVDCQLKLRHHWMGWGVGDRRAIQKTSQSFRLLMLMIERENR